MTYATKDYLVKVKVQNNMLHKAMLRSGVHTAVELAAMINCTPSQIGFFLNLKLSALNSRGQVREVVYKMAAALKCDPEDLFPPQHYASPLSKNTSETEMSFEEVQMQLGYSSPCPQQLLESAEIQERLEGALSTLSPREQQIIDLHLYQGLSYEEVGLALDKPISATRVNQIYSKAIRRLKHPSKSGELRALLGLTKKKGKK